MYDLSTLGFGPFFEAQLIHGESIPARIAAEHRGGYKVWAAAGAGLARLAGRLSRDLEGEALPGVGDWVTLRSVPGEDTVAVIDGVLGRHTVFLRGAAGRETRGQVIAANVDIVFIVCGLDADYNVRRIERYLARVWASGATPAVLLNKGDLCDDIDARVDEVARSCLGVPVHVVSALRAEGIEVIREHLGVGITGALVGSSGAGKSTLINALLGEERMATGGVRARDGRGSHTTTHRQLVLLPDQGLLMDTPGMRELQLFDEEGIGTAFSDISDIAAGCRFRDCRHQSEPGCAVREAVTAGNLSTERLEHFLKMKEEAHAYEVRHDERLRREADRALGKQYARAAKTHKRWKEGQ